MSLTTKVATAKKATAKKTAAKKTRVKKTRVKKTVTKKRTVANRASSPVDPDYDDLFEKIAEIERKIRLIEK